MIYAVAMYAFKPTDANQVRVFFEIGVEDFTNEGRLVGVILIVFASIVQRFTIHQMTNRVLN